MTVSKLSTELLDDLLSDYKKPEDLIGENGLLKQLTKALVERALEAEMEHHLGHARHDSVTNATGNARNGRSSKTLKGEFGELPIKIPRDRHGIFEPQIVGNPPLRDHFVGYENLSMRGLYWLSKDILDNDNLFKDTLDPDAQALKQVRNHLEHKYCKIHDSIWSAERYDLVLFASFKDTLAYSVKRDDLEAKTLRLLKLVREGLIYLSLAVHREEYLRNNRSGASTSLPMELRSWDDEWKR